MVDVFRIRQQKFTSESYLEARANSKVVCPTPDNYGPFAASIRPEPPGMPALDPWPQTTRAGRL